MEQRLDRDRRATAAKMHLPERRTGFDRRRRHVVLSPLRDDPARLAVLLGGFVALSVADGALTAYELAAGIAVEANPFLSSLVQSNPGLAAAFKLATTILVALAIWHGRAYRKILAVGVFALSVYGALLGYHLVSLRAIGAL